MKNNKISISLFRVSIDSQYLDMMFDCPEDYYFTSLLLEVRSVDSKLKKFISQFFDLSNALFILDGEPIKDQNNWVVRIPLEKLGILYPAIYKATFKMEPIEGDADCGCEENCLEDHAICSDVNQAYKCMVDDLMKLDDPCFEISDEVIRKYLLLYGHQSALAAGDYEIAERYFKLIISCFDVCSNTHGCGCCGTSVKVSTNSCNCSKS